MSKDQHPGLESLKSKSIYEVSSFGTLKVNQKEKHLINKDREQLKLNFDSNIKGSNNKLKKSKDER